MKKLNFLFAILIPLSIVFYACDDQEAGNARIVVKLTDAPADYQEVNIDIQSVEVNAQNDNSGWNSLDNINPGVYNILELTNGLSVVLADAEIPAGYISQLRLILGDNNTLKLDDVMHDLSTPSAQQSGVKLQINTTLMAGITYEILLDFDAARSVVEAGNSGKYNLKPVVRAIAEAQDGGISGIVLPLEATPVIYAIQGQDTITSAYTDSEGAFLLQKLEPGSYTVGIEPVSGYNEEILTDIQVALGEINDVGTIQLAQ